MNRAQRAYAAPAKSEAEIVRDYAALLERCARGVARRTGGAVTAEDLWSAGALGLIEAWRRFNATKGARFETFAEHRVRGAMLDELRKLDHLPRRLRAETEKVRKAKTKLEHVLGRVPQADELAAELQMELDDVAALEGVSETPVEWTPELLLKSEGPDALESAERKEAVALLEEAIAQLPERLAILLSLHYVEELTYKEIAQVLEVSEPRVCQLHAEAVSKLRERLHPSR